MTKPSTAQADADDETGPRQLAQQNRDQALLLTVVEAADALNVGRSTVYELIYAKQLPSVKIGNCRRIKRSDLEATSATFVSRRRSVWV